MTDREKYISLLKPEATKDPTMEEIQKIKTPEQIGCTKALQELVDKATPKKPNIIKKTAFNISLISIECPNCKKQLKGKVNFCDECGQKLDWSDNDE